MVTGRDDVAAVPAGNVPIGNVPIGNVYDKYAATNPVERRFVRGFLAALDASMPPMAPSRVLEVGAGEGEVSRRVQDRFPAAAVAGLDLLDAGLGLHWRQRGLRGVFGDLALLPFPDDAFDLVLAIEVLEHVPDPEEALGEIARVASADLIVSVPREPLWRGANLLRGKYVRDVGNTPGHLHHWSRGGFARLVGRRFEIVEVRSPFPWTMVQAHVR